MSYVVSKYKLPKRIEDNIMLCFFKLSVYAGLAVYNLIDGLMDEFEDETGVDVAGSANESYDAANDLYQPAESASQDIISNEVAETASGGLGDWADVEYRPAQIFTLTVPTKIISFKVKLYGDSGIVGQPVGRIETVVGGFASGNLADANLTKAFTPTGAMQVVTFDTPAILQPGTYVLKFDIADQATDKHINVAWSGNNVANSNAQTLIGGVWSNSLDNDTCMLLTGTIRLNMTLISNAVAAEAVPTKSRIVLFEEDVNAITVNTDIKAYVSRDGGTTYTQHTLVDEGNYETGKRILSSEAAAISGQPSGQSMKWKVESLNNKDLKLHAVGVSWD